MGKDGSKVMVSSTNPHLKEMAIRRRITSIFNKREEDFPSLNECNDYLEKVEVMTINLVEGIDIAATEAKIAIYQEENAAQIMINQARKVEELATALAASKGQPVYTDKDGTENQTSQVGFVALPQGQHAPAFPGGQPRPTGMATQPLLVRGGDIEGYGDDEESMRIRAERGARAGGWSLELSNRRILEEAVGSIWIC